MTPADYAANLCLTDPVGLRGAIEDQIRLAMAQARAEGRAAALEDAAQLAHALVCEYGYQPERIAARIRSLINQGRDEVAPSLAEKK